MSSEKLRLISAFVSRCSVYHSRTNWVASRQSRKYSSSYSIAMKERNALFNEEKERQRQRIGRVEKIEVKYKGVPENVILGMNKGISTPFHCAQHMSTMLVERSALACVNGELWDMHKPLEEDCDLLLLHFRDTDPFHLNKAFWRTCSFLLGATIMNIFKEHVSVKLHSFPSPNVKSGSFVYDVDLNLEDWKPTQDELRVISAAMVKLTHDPSHSEDKFKIERLDVSADLAMQMFSDNGHKMKQIPSIAQANGSQVTLYRFQDHIDISRGPMIANSAFIGRCTIAAVHKIVSGNDHLYRFQGVALPSGIKLNHFSYGILEERARKLNHSWLPKRSKLEVGVAAG
ncbi:39S ribosomal protein L39, mitochondrial [Ischnura elegans]|uniref:39S ribosomal protein L39, mitochondrial n=1 Tax=Ischnura elegans TaxID=197161 RepID=UPI001ED88AC7|nr:39S ribosomal protein L39, mitochondrial [Ischnura elegans]